MNREVKIYELLKELGVPPSLLGYMYLKYAIEITIQDFSLVRAITKRLYPEIAKEFQTTCSRAERVIRHAIEVSWERGNIDTMHKLFGYTVSADKGKPTNSEFIATIAEHFRIAEKKECEPKCPIKN